MISFEHLQTRTELMTNKAFTAFSEAWYVFFCFVGVVTK